MERLKVVEHADGTCKIQFNEYCYNLIEKAMIKEMGRKVKKKRTRKKYFKKFLFRILRESAKNIGAREYEEN